MTEPLPQNVRQAGYDALAELSNRMSRGAASLFKHAMLLRLDNPKNHRKALAQLRRYQTFGMPCSENVAKIEGALMGLTEAESKAFKERQSLKKSRQERANKKERTRYWEESWQRGEWQHQDTVRRAKDRGAMLFQAATYAEKNVGGVKLVKALAQCLDAKMADQQPFAALGLQIGLIEGWIVGGKQRTADTKDNVVPLHGEVS